MAKLNKLFQLKKIWWPCFLPGAEIRSVCTEAGMFAIRARRKIATEKDFLEAVNKVIKSYAKFSATPRYMTYNWVVLLLEETEVSREYCAFIVIHIHLKIKVYSRFSLTVLLHDKKYSQGDLKGLSCQTVTTKVTMSQKNTAYV